MNLPLVMLGVGQTALHLAKLAPSYKLFGTTRDKNKLDLLSNASIEPFYISPDFPKEQQKKLAELLTNAKVLASFPPDGESDKFFSALCAQSNSIIYISSTSVYGNHTGVVDEFTEVDRDNPASKLRLEAEDIWLSYGAIVLRAPGLYSAQSGLHLPLKNGTYRLPSQANNYISRIHLLDLAKIILAVFAMPLPAGSIRLVSDLRPASQEEVVEWLCQVMNLPLPPLAAPDTVPTRATSNRRVQANNILKELNIQLQFPTYKEGYTYCLETFKETVT